MFSVLKFGDYWMHFREVVGSKQQFKLSNWDNTIKHKIQQMPSKLKTWE